MFGCTVRELDTYHVRILKLFGQGCGSAFVFADPAVFLNADPDPAYEVFSLVEKNIKILFKTKKQWSLCKFT